MSILVKLGTVLNTVGSLGVGYYVGKFNLVDMSVLVSPEGTIFHTLDLTQNLQLFGSVAILGIGLILRIKDLLQRKHEKEELVFGLENKEDDFTLQGERYLDRIAHLQGEIKELKNRHDDTKAVIRDAVQPYIRDFVKEEIEEAKKIEADTVPISKRMDDIVSSRSQEKE